MKILTFIFRVAESFVFDDEKTSSLNEAGGSGNETRSWEFDWKSREML